MASNQRCSYHIKDITYQSLAVAFNQPLVHHEETLRRMTEMSKHRIDVQKQTEEQRTARERMALFSANAEAIFISGDLWVVSFVYIHHFFLNNSFDLIISFLARC
jgi:hypothetical protein